MFPTVWSGTPWAPHLGQRSVGSLGFGTWMGMASNSEIVAFVHR